MVTKSKYAYSSSSKLHAWELRIPGMPNAFRFRTKKEAIAAERILLKYGFEFRAMVELESMNDGVYFAERNIVFTGERFTVIAEHRLMERDENLSSIDLESILQ